MKTRIIVTVLLIVCLISLSDQTVKAQDNEITITDLGTLGEASYPWNLNDLGQVVGESDAGFGDRRSFLWTEEGGMQDLNPIFGGHYGQAIYINNLGQIVGHYYTTGGQHAFLWSPSEGFLDLGTLANDPTQGGSSYPRGVNNFGQVIGYSNVITLDGVSQTHAFSWSKDKGMQDLGTLASAYAWNSRAEAIDINEAGEVVGWSDTPSWQAHVFLWTPKNGIQDLGIVVNRNSGLKVYINNHGQIAGTRFTESGKYLAFTWASESGLIDLGTLSGTLGSESFVQGINDRGQIVGWSDTFSGYSHAFIWSPEHGMEDLGTLGGNGSSASDINNFGQVVGSSGIPSGGYHAFVWSEKEGMVDLGTLGGNSTAWQINNNGQVIGVSRPGGLLRATLWTIPIPLHFPPILDDFNRPDGSLSSNWLGYKSAYRVLGNHVDVRRNGPIYWKDAFSVDQEVAVTLTKVDPAGLEQNLLLKVQGQYGPNWGEGAIEVLYNARTGTVAVWTFRLDTLEWFEYPAIPVTFADGDQFGAQALSTGDVVIYKNGMEVGRVTLNPADQAFFNPRGGYIGLWFIDARNAFFDDFGGGDVKIVPPSYP